MSRRVSLLSIQYGTLGDLGAEDARGGLGVLGAERAGHARTQGAGEAQPGQREHRFTAAQQTGLLVHGDEHRAAALRAPWAEPESFLSGAAQAYSQGGLALLQAPRADAVAHHADDSQAPAPAALAARPRHRARRARAHSRPPPPGGLRPAAPARGHAPPGAALPRARGPRSLLSGLLNLWALDRNGWANQYYSAAVRSMSSSWHNFLYDSFDPSGLMTVDKPPLALWVQALSARVFGFHSWSILVPQALMGVATVALVYDLTRRLWGRTAGFVAGLVLAVTPITVAISRHNNPDALLALCCVGALWCLVRALQDGRTRWIVLAGVCVGLGFETKMGAALLVVPAIVAAWLWVAPRGRLDGAAPAAGRRRRDGRRRRRLAAADDAHARVEPPVDLGHERQQHPQPDPRTTTASAASTARPAARRTWAAVAVRAAARRSAAPPARCGCSTRASAGRPAGCSASPLVAIVALAVATRLRRADARTGWLVATGGMFLTIAVAFSFAQGIFHPYYVAQLAPFTAALVGAGVGLVPARATAPRASARPWRWRPAWRPSCSCCTTSPAS